MGKCKEPRVLIVDDCFMHTPEVQELQAKGHGVTYMNFEDVDLSISPKAQMTPPGRLAYVVKKLKEIVKEVARG